MVCSRWVSRYLLELFLPLGATCNTAKAIGLDQQRAGWQTSRLGIADARMGDDVAPLGAGEALKGPNKVSRHSKAAIHLPKRLKSSHCFAALSTVSSCEIGGRVPSTEMLG